MEAIKKLLRTPSALALIIVAVITLIGVIVQSNSSKAVVKLTIDATSTAEAKLALSAIPPNTPTLAQGMQIAEQLTTTSIPTETAHPNSMPTNTLLPIIAISVADTLLPTTPTTINQFNISVPANAYWYNTNIAVRQGQQLEFTANGKWGSGIGDPTGPDGDSSHNCDKRYIHCGNLGALVGAIGMLNSDKNALNDAAFLIGSSSTQVATSDGILFLAMNDNIGPCQAGIEGSCYDDNFYSLEVTIRVK